MSTRFASAGQAVPEPGTLGSDPGCSGQTLFDGPSIRDVILFPALRERG
jgi:hypothetical protein